MTVQSWNNLAFKSVCAIVLAAALAAPFAADAEQPKEAYQIGVILHGGSYLPAIEGLREGLRSSGLEEGRHWAFQVHVSGDH